MLTPARFFCALAALGLPAVASAHGFGQLYNLPVPFWLYAWGAAAALLVSFLIVGFFIASPAMGPPAVPAARFPSGAAAMRQGRWLPLLQSLAVFALLLCMATGFFGHRDPYRNFSMTFFWIVFVLGCTYLSALIGDFYSVLNPWCLLAGGVERFIRGYARGRVRYPETLGEWPALAFYMGFIWFELFGHGKPFTLASMLLAYTLINLAGVGLVGAAAWFRHCEFFGVFLRLVALMAPLEYRREGLRWRPPFADLVHQRPEQISTVVFALFMLSSTAFDGLRATQWWVGLFWNDPAGIVTALVDTRPVMAYARLRPWYIGWETFWLLASPFIYLGAYLAAVALAKLITRSARPLRDLALDFGYTLLPIALVYNATHYVTLLLSQGPKIVSLLSDPFGWGWDLFGTADLWRAPILPDLGVVWHAQVGLILFGHIVSVVVAHRVALRVFPTRRQAAVSQAPMLGLMVSFTVAGLWILAQPLTAMLMR